MKYYRISVVIELTLIKEIIHSTYFVGCEDDQFRCYDSVGLECISQTDVCNRISDCTNIEDERNCTVLDMIYE